AGVVPVGRHVLRHPVLRRHRRPPRGAERGPRPGGASLLLGRGPPPGRLPRPPLPLLHRRTSREQSPPPPPLTAHATSAPRTRIAPHSPPPPASPRGAPG